MDVAVFSPLKRKWTDAVWERFQWGNHTVKKTCFWEILQQAREAGLSKQNILSGFEATGIYPLNAQKILPTLPGYDSYCPSTPTNTTIAEDISSFNPLSSSTPQTPKTEHDIEKLVLFAENSIHRNTPSSRSARTAVRLLAHSASYYCSSLNLRDETERKKKQYLIEESINSGKKGRKRIKVDNTVISAGDVKQVIQANFGGRHKAVKTSLDHYTH